jgi:hypothetical protein
MRYRGIAGDNEVEALHQRRRIDEPSGPSSTSSPMSSSQGARARSSGRRTFEFLQADQARAATSERCQCGERHGAALLPIRGRGESPIRRAGRSCVPACARRPDGSRISSRRHSF